MQGNDNVVFAHQIRQSLMVRYNNPPKPPNRTIELTKHTLKLRAQQYFPIGKKIDIIINLLYLLNFSYQSGIMEESIHIKQMELFSKIINSTPVSCIIKKTSKANLTDNEKKQCKSIKSSQQSACFQPNVSMNFSKNQEKKIEIALAMRNARQCKLIGNFEIDITNVSNQSYSIYQIKLKSDPQSMLKVQMKRKTLKQSTGTNQFNKNFPTAYEISRKNYKNAQILRQQDASKSIKHGNSATSNKSNKSTYQYRYRAGQQSPVPRNKIPEPIKINNQNIDSNKESRKSDESQNKDKYKPITEKLQQIHGLIKQKQADKTFSQLNQTMKSKESFSVNSSLIRQFQFKVKSIGGDQQTKNTLNLTDVQPNSYRSEDFSKIILLKDNEISKVRQQSNKKMIEKQQESLRHIEQLSKILVQKQSQISNNRQTYQNKINAKQQQILNLQEKLNQQIKNKEKQINSIKQQSIKKIDEKEQELQSKMKKQMEKKKEEEVSQDFKILKEEYKSQNKELNKILKELELQKNMCLQQEEEIIYLKQQVQDLKQDFSYNEKQLKKKAILLDKMGHQYDKIVTEIIQIKQINHNLQEKLKKQAQKDEQPNKFNNFSPKDKKQINNEEIMRFQNRIKMLQQQNGQKILEIHRLNKKIDQIQLDKKINKGYSFTQTDEKISILQKENISLKNELQYLKKNIKKTELQADKYKEEVLLFKDRLILQEQKNQLKDGQIDELQKKSMIKVQQNKDNEEIKDLKYKLKSYQLQFKAKESQNKNKKLQIDDLKMEIKKLQQVMNQSSGNSSQISPHMSTIMTKNENEALKKQVKSLQDQLNELIGLFTYMKSNITKMAEQKRQEINKKIDIKQKIEQKSKIMQLRNEIFDKLKQKSVKFATNNITEHLIQ